MSNYDSKIYQISSGAAWHPETHTRSSRTQTNLLKGLSCMAADKVLQAVHDEGYKHSTFLSEKRRRRREKQLAEKNSTESNSVPDGFNFTEGLDSCEVEVVQNLGEMMTLFLIQTGKVLEFPRMRFEVIESLPRIRVGLT